MSCNPLDFFRQLENSLAEGLDSELLFTMKLSGAFYCAR